MAEPTNLSNSECELDDPERSYRRGYQQGAYDVSEVVLPHLSPSNANILKNWIFKALLRWRLGHVLLPSDAGVEAERRRGVQLLRRSRSEHGTGFEPRGVHQGSTSGEDAEYQGVRTSSW